MTEIFRSYFYDEKKNRKRSAASTAMFILLFVLLMVGLLGGIFAMLSVVLCPVLAGAGMDWMYFALMGLIAILLGSFGSVFNTYAGLYLAKDNDLLFSLPIPVRYIMFSRLLTVYLMGLMYSAVVIVPAVIVYWIMVPISVGRLIGPVLLTFLISVFVLVLSCLLGWVVAKISRKLKYKSFLTVLAALLFFGAYYFFFFHAQTLLSELMQNVMIYGEKIRGAAYPLYLFGAAGTGDVPAMFVVTAAVAVSFALVWYLLSRSFVSLATAADGTKKTKYQEKQACVRGIRTALLGREFGRFTSSANYMLNCGLGTVLMPVLGVFLLIKGEELILPMYEALGEYTSAIPVVFCLGVCVLSSMNDMATPSVSLEGKNLWIAQSLPVSAWQVLGAKLSVHIILTLIPALFTAVCAIVILPEKLLIKALIVAVVLLYTLLSACFDLFLGLKMPNLTWTNELAPIKQSGSVMLALLGGWGYEAALIGLFFLVRKYLSAGLYLAVCALITALLAGILYAWLKKKGAAVYAAL